MRGRMVRGQEEINGPFPLPLGAEDGLFGFQRGGGEHTGSSWSPSDALFENRELFTTIKTERTGS